jgi:hypothetical protein
MPAAKPAQPASSPQPAFVLRGNHGEPLSKPPSFALGLSLSPTTTRSAQPPAKPSPTTPTTDDDGFTMVRARRRGTPVAALSTTAPVAALSATAPSAPQSATEQQSAAADDLPAFESEADSDDSDSDDDNTEMSPADSARTVSDGADEKSKPAVKPAVNVRLLFASGSDKTTEKSDTWKCLICDDDVKLMQSSAVQRITAHLNFKHHKQLTAEHRAELARQGFTLRPCVCEKIFALKGFKRHTRSCAQAQEERVKRDPYHQHAKRARANSSRPAERPNANEQSPSATERRKGRKPAARSSSSAAPMDTSEDEVKSGKPGDAKESKAEADAADASEQQETWFEFVNRLTAKDLAEFGPVHDKVPDFAKERYVNIFKQLGMTILRHRTLRDKNPQQLQHQQRYELLVKSVFFIQSHLLRRYSGRASERRRKTLSAHKQVEDAIRQIVAAEQDGTALHMENKRDLQQQQDPVVQAINRSLRFLSLRLVSKAAKSLMAKPIANADDPAVIQKMRDLHPDCDDKMPALPDDAPERFISPTDERFIAILRKMHSKGSAAGASRMAASHLLPLLNDKHCVEMLSAIATDVINGRWSDVMRDFLLTGKGVPLTKANGSGIRPIGIKEVIVRAATSWAVAGEKDEITKASGESQLGGGVRGGVEAAVHAIQDALDSPVPTAVLHLDIANCFQTRHRRHILAKIMANPNLRLLQRLAHFLYKAPTKVLVLNSKSKVVAEILSKQGVSQGCPLGTAGADISLEEDHAATKREAPGITLLAIHDDTYLIGPPDQLKAAYDAFRAHAAQNGSLVQPTKSELLYFHDAPLSDRVKEWAQTEQLKLVQGACQVLGAVVAKSYRDAKPVVKEILDDHYEFFKRVEHPHMPSQQAFVLLRASGAGRVNHLIRCTKPTLLQSDIAEFDKEIWRVAKLKAERPDNEYDPQWVIPVADGGWGFRSQAETAPFAFIASRARTAIIRHKLGILASEDARAIVSDVLRNLVQPSMGLLPEKIKQKLVEQLPSSAEDFDQFYANQPELADDMQANLSAINTAKAVREQKINSPIDQARLASIKQSNANRWLMAIPTDPSTTLTNAEFKLAVRNRTINATDRVPPATCGLCNKPTGSDWSHAFNCVKIIPNEGCKRHNMVVRVIKRNVEEAGGACSIEPRGLHSRSNKRPDGDVMLGLSRYLFDVMITNSAAPSHIAHERKTIENAESKKVNKYEDLSDEQDGTPIVPFVLNAFGEFGDGALSFIERVVDHANSQRVSHCNLREQFLNEVSIAVQRGNAYMLNRMMTFHAGVASDRALLAQLSNAAAMSDE